VARRANAGDAEEIVRLRGVMLAAVDGEEPEPGPWQRTSVELMRRQLPGDATVAAFVVDHEEPGRLAACAVGTIDHRLASPRFANGLAGYVYNVATDPDSRRRGCSRACMEGLIGWFREHGVARVDLWASDEGGPLYRSLGFRDHGAPSLRLLL
jgi:GNAT superfamily N-acetyltransferase